MNFLKGFIFFFGFLFFFIFPLKNEDIKLIKIGEEEFIVEISRTDKEKREGLSKREDLPKGHGMLFLYEEADNFAYQTMEMFFPIDIVFIKEKEVVEIFRNVLPGNIVRATEKADAVFETNINSKINEGNIVLY